jgi:hypothetical protein
VIDPKTLPRQSEVGTFYGKPGPMIEAQLAMFDLPMALRLDWDLAKTTKRVRLHRKCGPAFVAAIGAVRTQYGEAEMKKLGIDRFAGGYAHRQMRGGTSWSMHAYGCAVDFYAGPNGLKVRCPDALFCGAVYKPFLDIMEAHGWLPAIRLWGADAMHFQMARL